MKNLTFLKRVLWLLIPLLTLYNVSAWGEQVGPTPINISSGWTNKSGTTYCGGYGKNSEWYVSDYAITALSTVLSNPSNSSFSLTIRVKGLCNTALSGYSNSLSVVLLNSSGSTVGTAQTITNLAKGNNSSSATWKSFTFTPTSAVTGYKIYGGKGCAVYSTEYTLTYTAAAVTTHTLSSAVSPTGTGTVSLSSTTVAEGSTATATASPNSGYRFSSWSISGTGASLSSTSTNPTTVTMGTANATVTANFVSKGCTDHGASSITSGASSGDDYGPLHANYDYSTSQILYTKSDLDLAAGKKGTIKSIYFEYSGAAAMNARTIKIYMANTDLSSLTTSNYVPYASFTQVYSGTFSCGSAGWYEIALDTPFDYNGIGNLVVMVDDNTNSYQDDKNFKYHSATGKQIYKRQDDTDIDPASWTPASAIDYRPNTKFCIQEADMTPATVTLMDNSETITEASAGAGVTLPSRAGCAGYTFAGWTKSWVAPQSSWTATAPTIIPAGSYTPAADENLYPVYTKTESGSGFSSYTKVTSAQSDWSGKYLISDGTLTATGSKFSSTALEVTTLTPGTTEYTSYEFTITKNGNNSNYFIITPDGTNYVGYSGSSAGLAFTTSTPASNNYLWTCSTSDPMTLNVGTNTRYIGVGTESATSVFKAYSTSGTNAKCYLYKRIEGGSTTYYISVPDCCTQLGSVSATNSAKTGTTANFTWSEVTGAESYKVKVPGSSSHNDWTTATSGVSVTGLTAGNSYTAYFKAFDSNGSHCAEGPESTIEFTTPKITLGSASGTSTYIEGNGPGSKQTFTVTAVGLTGNLTVTAPTNFEVCDTENGTYASSKTLTATSGAVSTTVYFQLVADKTAAASPYAGNVTVSGGSATEQTVAVNGTVNQACADPTITVQPAASASYNLNVSAAALSVTATKNGTGPALTYQWYSNTANSKTTPTPSPIDGATSSSYTPPTTAAGTKYYFCEVSSGACAVTSNISAITVNTPSITVSETSIAFGDKAKDGSHTATFTVSGTNLASSTGLTLAITGSSYFTIDQSSVAQTSAGTVSTTTITVTYAPTVIGDGHSATITVSSTGATNKTVTLSGNSKYQITWVDEAASPAATTYTYVASGKPTFPSNPTGGCDTYTYFYGWSEGTFTTPVTAPGTSSAIKVYKSASEMPNVSGNVTYYAVWSNAAPADYSTTYTSNVTLPTSGTNAYSANVTISGNNYSGAKIGKSGGAGSSSFTVPSGTKKIFLHTVNWYNEDNTLTLSSGTLGVTISPSDAITPPRNSGMDGSDNDFTLATLDGTQYKEYTLTGVSSTATINVSSTSRLLVWGINATSSTGEGNCVTSCCEEVAARGGSVTMGSTSATVSWSVTGTAASKISSWDVTCSPAGTKGSITGTTTKSVEFTGLTPNTAYTFHIVGTSNDAAYCDVDDELSGTTECLTPSSLSISSTGNKWDFCAGETMTLTVNGTNISGSATYQWQKHNGSTWVDIDGATNVSYSTTMAANEAGQYRCTVTNPGSGSCDATTDGVWVRVWQLHLGDDDIDFTCVSGTTGSNSTVHLNSDTHYEFKLKDNNGGWFGLNDKTITATISAFALNGSGANVNVTSGLEGNYTFTINYSDKNNPTIAVTYPVGNQLSGKKIWFDKSVITGWTDAGTSDLVWRIGKSNNSMTNEDATANAFALVPGTDRFYVYETKEYNGFEAWHIANNTSWSGTTDGTGERGIYYHYHNQAATDVTRATVYQKYVVGNDGVTLVPTTKKNTDYYCDFWNVTKYDGMLTHTATITPPTNGTITIANAAQSLEATTTTSDLPHRTILTVTATPAPGYQLSSLTVNGEAFTSGNEHILSADATIAATFTAKTITITWNENGGNTPSPTESSYTYNGSTVSLATVTHATKLFAGWFTDPSAGTQITEIGTTNKPTADVTYYAHWVDGNTVYFNPGAGTVTPASATQTSIGGSVPLPTPTPTCDGWTFQGWKIGSTQTEVTELPDGLVTGSYVPESATVQMYAVYKKAFDETSPQSVTVDWEASSGYLTGWSTTGSWSRATRSTNHAGLVAASATLKYNTKVAVKSVSAKFMRESNKTTGAFMFEKSTDGVNWSDVDTDNWHTPAEATKNEWFSFGYAQKDGFFNGTTEYYIRLNFTTDGNSDRLFDDITITYNATSSVTHYATSPLECAQVATPVITPEGDSYTGAQDITISCATDGATIKYTTDDSDPSSSNGTTIASGSSFTLSCSGTVKAIAYKDGMSDSEIASETYTITAPGPTFSPDGGDFKVAQSVSLSDALAGTTVYYEYTTDGSEPSDPTSSSTAYSSTPISVAVGQTVRVKAIAISDCATSSTIVSKTFRVGWNFELVTDEDDLNVGDKIVILSGTTNALSTYREDNYNRTASSDFNISGTTVTAYPPSTNSATTVQVITLDGGPGDWKLKTTDTKWFNCPSAGKLTTVTTDGSTAEEKAARKWSIDIGSSPNYYAIITNNNVTDATIQYGTVFAAYATDQYPVKIYSIPNPDPLLKVEGTLSAFAGCTSAASAAQSFYVSGKNLSADIRVSAPTGYEVSLSSGSGYAAYIDVARVGTMVSKTQVYVRLKAGDAGAVAANNIVVSVEANSLSQNVAIPASTISAADTYIDRMHGNSTTYECGSYSAPNLSDDPGSTGTDCQKTYLTFQGWVAASDVNLDGTLKAGATVISNGTAMTANGTTYYSVWGEEEP